jgi:hypothetical protein
LSLHVSFSEHKLPLVAKDYKMENKTLQSLHTFVSIMSENAYNLRRKGVGISARNTKV